MILDHLNKLDEEKFFDYDSSEAQKSLTYKIKNLLLIISQMALEHAVLKVKAKIFENYEEIVFELQGRIRGEYGDDWENEHFKDKFK